MANSNDTSATKALNEDAYINKIYDNVIDKQKNLLKENYVAAGTALDTEKQSVQQQTNTNLGRVNVEAQKLQQAYKGPKLSTGAGQQAALAMDNQQKKNVTAMRTVQSEADTEIDRQRKLLAEQYSTAIKKAQADNDMARAQQLYEAAKAEEEQLLSLRTEAGNLLSAKGDNSVLTSLLGENPVTRDTSGETWGEVRKREDYINKIYDSAVESDKQAAQMALNEAYAKLDAQQASERATTDKQLTQTYVDALKNAKNYNEVQSAYGLGSGTLAQSRLARALGLTEDLANLRGVQMGAAAQQGQQRFAASQTYRDALLSSLASNEQKRAQALYDAAEDEEQTLIGTQKDVGNTLAAQGDYSVLGRLYGLTQDQIDRLQGTGVYAPVYYGSGDGGGGSGSGGGDSVSGSTIRDVVDNLYGGNHSAISDKALTAEEAEQLKQNLIAAAEQQAKREEYQAEQAALVDAIKEQARANAKSTSTSSSNKSSTSTGSTNKTTSGSSGGGSSVHASTSGTTHGGGGGSFGSSSKSTSSASTVKPLTSTQKKAYQNKLNKLLGI